MNDDSTNLEQLCKVQLGSSWKEFILEQYKKNQRKVLTVEQLHQINLRCFYFEG